MSAGSPPAPSTRNITAGVKPSRVPRTGGRCAVTATGPYCVADGTSRVVVVGVAAKATAGKREAVRATATAMVAGHRSLRSRDALLDVEIRPIEPSLHLLAPDVVGRTGDR